MAQNNGSEWFEIEWLQIETGPPPLGGEREGASRTGQAEGLGRCLVNLPEAPEGMSSLRISSRKMDEGYEPWKPTKRESSEIF
jgi:hypothetical protein